MNQTQQSGSKAYLYSVVLVAVLGGLLFGYDTAVISGAEKGLQAFFMEASDFEYNDLWHGFTSASALIGCIIGSLLSGYLATKLGRKKSLIIAGLLFFVSALGSMEPEFLFFKHGEPLFSLLLMFNFYRIIGGIGVGLASAICPMYIGEIAPYKIRGMLVSCQPLVEEMGKGIAAINPAAQWTVTTGWRYMFGSEAIPAGLFALLICFVPESPRYLVSIGKNQEAFNVLANINGSSKAEIILPEIVDSLVVKTEKLMTYGWMCIFVGIMLSVFQQVVGINAVLYYAPRTFGDMGMQDPMMITVIMGFINIMFTLVAIFTVEKLGRKPLLITGSIGMAIGALGVAATFGHEGLEAITCVSLMLYAACFMFSWGPICWVLIAEIFPNTIRGKAVAIAVAFQWIFNFIVSSSFVPMFNMHLTEGDDFGHWFTYGLYGILCIVAAIFVWKLVPETKRRTLEEMAALWKSLQSGERGKL